MEIFFWKGTPFEKEGLGGGKGEDDSSTISISPPCRGREEAQVHQKKKRKEKRVPACGVEVYLRSNPENCQPTLDSRKAKTIGCCYTNGKRGK